jgi:hypothetical protein
MPANMLTDSAPMIVSVFAALRGLGLRNAGTPLLMASTPVSAVQPDANAFRNSDRVRMPPTLTCWWICSCAVEAAARCPVSSWTTPTPMSRNVSATNA